VLLIGRLTADPEIRYTPSGLPIANMRMAVNNFRKGADGNRVEEAVYVDVTGFGRTAELAQQYLKKGRQVFIEGRLHFDQWDDKNTGQKRSKLSVNIDNLQFLDGGGRGEGGGSGPDGGGDAEFGGGGGGGNYRSSAPRGGDRPPSDEDVPF
jgi:single-strand DNA-binding protein